MQTEHKLEQNCFYPDVYPENTLKAFNQAVDPFELRYEAQFPDPPKVSIDAAIEQWKYANFTDKQSNLRPSLEQHDKIRKDRRSKNKTAKFVGMFSSKRVQSDWKTAQALT